MSALNVLGRLRGDWKPGIPPWVALAVQLVLAYQTLMRGTDYATGDAPELARSLGTVEDSAPLWVWGVLFISSMAVLVIGMLVKQVGIVVAGHAMAAALYAGIAYGVLQHNVAQYGWFDGYRTPSGLFCASALGALLAIGTRLDHVRYSAKEKVRHEHSELVP